MLGERTLELDEATADDLPVLTPRHVAPDTEIDEVIRRERAEVARLTLKLRSTLHEVSQSHDLDESSVDIDGAHELLQASLERHLEKRRADFADAVERARLEAASIVAVAHHEASALVAAANAAIVEMLLDGVTAVPDDAAPSLRIVEEDEVADRAARSAHPTGWQPDQAIAPPAEATDVFEDEVLVPTDRPVVARPTTEGVAPPSVDPNIVAIASYLAATMQLPAVPARVAASAVSAPTAVPAVPAAQGRWSIKQFLYLDVVLPIIAVLIVVIVLMAWVG